MSEVPPNNVETTVTCMLLESGELAMQMHVAREAKLGYMVGRVFTLCGGDCDPNYVRAEILRQTGLLG